MGSWKKILVDGDNTNIGTQNLSTPASSARALKLGASGSFNINSSDSVSAFKVTKTSCFLGGPSSENTSLVSGKSGTEGIRLNLATSGTQTSSATFETCNSLTLRNHSNTSTSASKLFLERVPADGNGLSNGEVVGLIDFKGQIDQTAAGAPASVVSFSKISSTAVNSQISVPQGGFVPEYSTKGKLEFSVISGANDFLAAEITDDGNASVTNNVTSNEIKLKTLKLGGKSMLDLASRSVCLLQYGENGKFTVTLNEDPEKIYMRAANGVKLGPGNDQNLSEQSFFGTVMHRPGFVTGGSLCYYTDEISASADYVAELKVLIINQNGANDIVDITSVNDDSGDSNIHFAHGVVTTNPRKTAVGTGCTFFEAGDRLVPYVELDVDQTAIADSVSLEDFVVTVEVLFEETLAVAQ